MQNTQIHNSLFAPARVVVCTPIAADPVTVIVLEIFYLKMCQSLGMLSAGYTWYSSFKGVINIYPLYFSSKIRELTDCPMSRALIFRTYILVSLAPTDLCAPQPWFSNL